jgi:hypothetical protein
MQSLAQARLKRVRAVELVAQGRSYDEIAHEVGYSHRGSAHRAVSKALAEREVDAVDQLRHTEIDRLDRLQASVWPKAMSGDVGAAHLIVKIIDRRIRLLGLADRERRDAEPRFLVLGSS